MSTDSLTRGGAPEGRVPTSLPSPDAAATPISQDEETRQIRARQAHMAGYGVVWRNMPWIATILGFGIPFIIINPLNLEVTCPKCLIGRVSFYPSLSEMLLCFSGGLLTTGILSFILSRPWIRRKVSLLDGRLNQIRTGNWRVKK